MAKYIYGATEKDWGGDNEEPKMVNPRLYLPLNAGQLQSLSVGDSIKVELTGRVLGLEIRKSEDRDSAEVRLELVSSEVENTKERDAIDEMIGD